MITAKFYCRPEDGTIHMEIRGHSGAAPKGEDLICCAATMLAYTAAQAVQFLFEQGRLQKRPKIKIRDGCATVIAMPTEEGYAETLVVFWVAQCGAHVLAHNYPDNVSLMHMKV